LKAVFATFDFDRWLAKFRPVLHEIKNVKQEAGAGRRRWFESDGLDLVVWLNADDAVDGFQICYDLGHGEHALTWREGVGFAHSAVDAGDETPLKNKTPVLSPDNLVPWSEIARLFDDRSASLEAPLRQLVHDKLAERAAAEAR
jgi:hypothetical protein